MGKKKHIRKKYINKMFTGLSRNFEGILFMCCFSPIRNDPNKKNRINNFLAPTQSWDNPAFSVQVSNMVQDVARL